MTGSGLIIDGGAGNDTYSRDWDLTFPDADFVLGVDLDREGLFLVSGEILTIVKTFWLILKMLI